MALMIGIASLMPSSQERVWVRDERVCGVILFGRNYRDGAQLAQLCATLRADRPELLLAVDQEGGRVQRFRGPGFTDLPDLMTLGQLHDREPRRARALLRAHARQIATEVQRHGLDLSFTPVADLALGNQAIGDRALHADPAVCAELVRLYVRALQRAGMAATLKHFPGHGSVLADTHHRVAVDRRGLDVLASTDLVPFAAGIAAGARAVMLAHVRYSAIDDVPAGFSRFLIKGVLRQELGFRGAVISDDIGMAAAWEMGSVADRVRAAEEAGCDIVLACNPGLVNEALSVDAIGPLDGRLREDLRGRCRRDAALDEDLLAALAPGSALR